MKNFNIIYTAGNQVRNFITEANDKHDALTHACGVMDLLNSQITGWFKLVRIEAM